MDIDTTDRGDLSDRAWRGITRVEWGAAAVAAVVLAGLAIAEPDILGAPFENTRTMVFTLGGTAMAAVALAVMVRLRVHPLVRIVVLGVPLVGVSWWLLSPFFIDDVVNDDFAVAISDAEQTPAARDGEADAEPGPAPDSDPGSSTTNTSDEPVLLGVGTFVGLAGHEGSGDAGFFSLSDGSLVLRLERFDIENGADLRLYVVPGTDQTDPGAGSVDLGQLRGNVGDQTYELPDGFRLAPGAWTVLVWCEAFNVEFVGATVTVA